MMATQYRLSALLTGHDNDVRSVAGSSSSELLSTSRDRTARAWKLKQPRTPTSDTSGGWQLAGTYSSADWINSSAWLAHPEDEEHPGFAVLGGQDAIINVFDLSKDPKEAPVASLVGHRSNVCALAASQDRVVSASWDGTARVWSTFPDFECLHELDHSSFGVWDVLLLGEDRVATACADGVVRLWVGASVAHLFKGHTGPVRALAHVASSADQSPNYLFGSASNDGSIRIWSTDGKPQGVLPGHDGDFVYALTQIGRSAGGGLVSSGEDGIIRVWSEDDGQLVQEILVPALSVWCLVSLANGDLAAGCSDNNLWLFTRDPARSADEQTTMLYEAGLAERKARIDSRSKPAPASSKSLPLAEAAELKQAGAKEGELKLVQAEGVTHAWQWTDGKWINLGEVVSGPGAAQSSQARKKLSHEGVLYDYLLSVDIADDQPHLKLAFNEADDLLEVASAFVGQHSLPESYTERIVDFMQQSMNA